LKLEGLAPRSFSEVGQSSLLQSSNNSFCQPADKVAFPRVEVKSIPAFGEVKIDYFH